MRIENGVINGDLFVTELFTLNGVLTGTVFVGAGGDLTLNGVAYHLVVQAGGRASLRGVVRGNVTNEGGILEVLGIVTGALNSISGQTSVGSGAIVSNKF